MEKQTLPKSVASLVLGILSIVVSCFIVGLVLGIIGLVLGNKSIAIYNENPDAYNGNGIANAGRICSIVGIVFGGLVLLYWVVIIGFIGVATWHNSGLGLL